jgi:hypothetical protein
MGGLMLTGEQAEEIAAALVEAGYTARSYPKATGQGHYVTVSTNTKKTSVRYHIDSLEDVPEFLTEVRRGRGTETLSEGVPDA